MHQVGSIERKILRMKVRKRDQRENTMKKEFT